MGKLSRSFAAGFIVASLCLAQVCLAQAPMPVYGAWHCGNDFCTWASERTTAEFDGRNHWLVNRGDGQPSVNLVVLAFVHPLRLLSRTTDAQTLNGVPRGMTPAIVKYFKDHGIRVMLSIGGITYVSAWNQALAQNPTQLGLAAADLASSLGVGIEIDYEENQAPNLNGLTQFIAAYRSVHPYDSTGGDPAARLTIDLAAGDRWLIALTSKASSDWLNPANPVLDYANAMVPARQPSAGAAEANWQEHIDGKSRYNPPIVPVAPAKLTGSLYLTGSKPLPECTDFSKSLQKATGPYVQSVPPHGAGFSSGMLGFMFWAAECQGTRTACTVPPNTCENGVGTGAWTFAVPIPMQPLKQQ